MKVGYQDTKKLTAKIYLLVIMFSMFHGYTTVFHGYAIVFRGYVTTIDKEIES